MKRIGLVAGGGKLPIVFAKKAHEKGITVIGFAIQDMALSEFDGECDRAHRVSIGDIKKFIFLLIAERIKEIVLLGKVDKTIMYRYLKKGEKAKQILETAKDKSDYSLLDRFTKELKKIGITVVDGMEYLEDLFPKKGVLTERKPNSKETEDIEFGAKIAKEIAGLDIGQTIIVKDKSVVSVEAMEGTDKTIERAASIANEGFSVVKVARPKQDMRWDVPVIGPDTVRCIAKNKGSILAIEKGKMFLVDQEDCVRIADENNISIVVL